MDHVPTPLDLSQKLVIEDFWLDETYNARAVAWLKSLDDKKITKMCPGNPKGAAEKMRDIQVFLKDITEIYGERLVVRRQYTNKSKMGRFYSTGAMGIWNPAASLLFDGVATDLDQVGSAARILQWLCKRFHIRCLVLDAYLQDREGFHNDYPGSRKKIKSLINTIFCDGEDLKGNKYPPLKELDAEAKRIQSALFCQQELSWLRASFGYTHNPYGKFTAHLTQAIEAHLTLAVMKHCESKGWTCNTMKHDGCLINGIHNDNKAVLEEFTDVCNILCPGMNMEWKWKELDFEIYNKDGEAINTISIDPAFVYNPERVSLDENSEPTYEQLFEEFSFKNGKPIRFRVYSVYVDMEKDVDTDTGFPIMAILSPKQFREAHLALKYFELVEVKDERGGSRYEKKECQFIDKWMKDKNLEARYLEDKSKRLALKRFAMRFDERKLCDGEVNTWRGFAGQMLDPPTDPEESVSYVMRFLNHVYMGCGQMKLFDFTIDWCAHMVQYPDIKIGIMLCLVSKLKGTGKTTLFEVLRKIVGEKACMQTKHAKDVCGDNNSRMLDRFFIRLVESTRAELMQNFDALKSTITDDEIRIRSLYEAVSFMKSYHRFFCDTNHLDAIPDTKGERRFFVLQWLNVHMNDKAYYNAFYDEIVKNPKAIASIYAYLMQRKIQKHYNADDIPISAYQSKLRAANRATAERFVEHIVLQQPIMNKRIEKSASELKEEYCCEFRRDDPQYRTDQVMRMLELNGISGVTKRSTTQHGKWVTLYQFDLEKLRKQFGHGMEEQDDVARGPIDPAIEMMEIEHDVRRAFGLIQVESGENDCKENEPTQKVVHTARDDSWFKQLCTGCEKKEDQSMEHEKRLQDAKRKQAAEKAARPPPPAKKSKVPDLFAERMREKGLDVDRVAL